MTLEETNSVFNSVNRMGLTGTAYLPANNMGGTNGNPCCPFFADSTAVSFIIFNAPGAINYNIQLYAGTPGYGYPASVYTPNVPVGNGVSFYNLIPGQNYYFMISSNSPGFYGCTATFSMTTF